MTNSIKRFTELDFDTIRSNLRTYMESQSQFEDYNFDGAVISTMLDVMAFNTLYNAVYANMSAAERFLQTAQLRNAVVGLAKNVGYTPRSVTAASANVTMTISYTGSGAPSSFTLPANTKFTGRNTDGTSLVFFTRSAVTMSLVSGSTYSATFDIYEGKQFTYKETFVSGQDGVTIPNTGVDTSLLTVRVRATPEAVTATTYTKALDYTQTTSQSNVYFVEEVDGEKHRIYFGDGVVGTDIDVGNQVEITYYKSSGTAGNGVNSFTLSSTLIDATVGTITVNSVAAGGQAIETIESIKKNAPYFYQAQNRAVTPRDYEAIVSSNFSYVSDILVWGGEDASPPSYGKVFMSIIPTFGEYLSDTQKLAITEFLEEEYAVMTIEAEVVDVRYIYLKLVHNVEYSTATSTLSGSQLKSQIISAVNSYDTTEIRQFGANFRSSQLLSDIDELDSSITRNTVSIVMSLQPASLLDVKTNNNLTFANPVEAGTFESNTFSWDIYTNVYLKDNSGNIELYRLVGGVPTAIVDSTGATRVAGTINYTTGAISLDSTVFDITTITSINGNQLELDASPTVGDIKCAQDQVIRIATSNLAVTVTDLLTNTVT